MRIQIDWAKMPSDIIAVGVHDHSQNMFARCSGDPDSSVSFSTDEDGFTASGIGEWRGRDEGAEWWQHVRVIYEDGDSNGLFLFLRPPPEALSRVGYAPAPLFP